MYIFIISLQQKDSILATNCNNTTWHAGLSKAEEICIILSDMSVYVASCPAEEEENY